MNNTTQAFQQQVQKIVKELQLDQNITTDITTYINLLQDIDIRENKPAGKQGRLICYTGIHQDHFTLTNSLDYPSTTHKYNYEDPQSITQWENQIRHTLKQWENTQRQTDAPHPSQVGKTLSSHPSQVGKTTPKH